MIICKVLRLYTNTNKPIIRIEVRKTMSSRKYAGDYRLENVERGGKLKAVAVYRGKRYRLADRAAFERVMPRLIGLATAFWLAQLIALLLRTQCAHIIYVIMPMVFAMLPFWMACKAIYSAVSGSRGTYFTREQSDKLQSRLAGGSVIAAALTGASFIGTFVYFVSSGSVPTAADIAFALCTAVQTAAGALCFTQRQALLTEEIPGQNI